ncbi:mitochondrial carrier domain-containing protein [Hyaloraphidium curvatum]|nr:mitochondrial carrier domain-containing protein [Hyaloraphidium curvatum]
MDAVNAVLKSDSFIQLVAGGAAGAASRTAVSPFERTKILFQIQSASPMGYHHKGTFDTLRWIYRTEGLAGYFKGNGTNVVRMVPYSAVQFASYEYYKKAIRYLSDEEEMDTPKRLLAGALAGITSVTATYPLDLVRTRLSMESARGGPKKGIWPVLKEVYRNEGGFPALYRGLVPTAGGVAPYVALNFASYELLRQYLSSSDPASAGPTNLQKLSAGALAGGLSQTITYPLDLLRRRMQVASLPGYPTPYRNTWDCVKSIWRTEGPRGFYKGMVANYLKIVPANAVAFVTYEIVKTGMGGAHTKGEM